MSKGDYEVKPFGNMEGNTLIYIKETGKYYIRVDAGDVSYYYDVPEDFGIQDLVSGDMPTQKEDRVEEWGTVAAPGIENDIHFSLERDGKLEVFETSDDFDGAILSGDLRDAVYVDGGISGIALEIRGQGVEGETGYVPPGGVSFIQNTLDMIENVTVDAPWWNNEDYIDEVGRAISKWGAKGYEMFKTYGSTETGESHNDILKRLGYDPRTFKAWTEYSQDEDSFNAKINDYKLQLQKHVNAKGGGLSNAAITYAANEWAWGRWSAAKATQQVDKAIDSYAFGDLDAGFAGVIGGEGFAEVTLQENEVQELIDTYLPIELQKAYTDKLQEYAGKIRNNPGFKNELIEQMKSERHALYPQYDKNLAWSNILSGKKSAAARIWDVDINTIKSDDPIILKLLGENKPENEAEILRGEGFQRGYSGVIRNYNNALTNAFGTGVVKSAGWID